MISRLEFLIFPRSAVPEANDRRLLELFAGLLTAPRRYRHAVGEYEIVLAWEGAGPDPVVPTQDGWRAQSPPGQCTISVGLEVTGDGWTVQPDRYALFPVYHGRLPGGGAVVSSRPDVVAAFVGSRVSLSALLEETMLTYLLDDATVYEDVRRIRPSEVLSYVVDRGFQVDPSEPVAYLRDRASDLGDHAWWGPVSVAAAAGFGEFSAQELTGGVDSRLVLALGLHAGAAPRTAITIGAPDSEDARIAEAICAEYGIEHLVIEPGFEERDLVADGRRFTALGGFGSINACSYCSLPASLDLAAPHRDVQIGGLGGECAIDFYGTPLDGLCAVPPLRDLWIRFRVFHLTPPALSHIDADAARAAFEDTRARIRRLFDRVDGDWRRKSNNYYLEQRMRQWSGAVLRACSSWYRPLHPLFLSEHIEWAAGLRGRQRVTRQGQMRMIHELVPRLVEFPFSENRAFARGAPDALRIRAKSFVATSQKIVRRVSRRRSRDATQRSSGVDVLLADERVRDSLFALGEAVPGLDAEALMATVGSPFRGLTFGPCVTAAWALESMNAFREVLS